MSSTLTLAVLISGNGSNLQAIIDAIEGGDLDARIKAVVSNNREAFGLIRASRHGLNTWIIDHRDYVEREQFDAALQHYLESVDPDLIVLAGFMRILGAAFVRAFNGRILNIHPSLLPAYPGLNTHRRALENGETEHGVSIHLVTAELDGGPVIAQASYPIEAGDGVEDLERKGHALEHEMFPWVLSLFGKNKLTIEGGQPFYEQAPLLQPLSPPA